MSKIVYLAGPEVFFPNPLDIGKRKKEICKRYGFNAIYPFDAELEDQESSIELAFHISSQNEIFIQECDIVVANLTPFRGPSADVGTVFELGYARGIGKYIHGYSTTSKPYYDRVREFDKKSSDLVDGDGFSIENFGGPDGGLQDNLMIPGAIQSTGGIFLAKNGGNLDIFEELIYKISKFYL